MDFIICLLIIFVICFLISVWMLYTYTKMKAMLSMVETAKNQLFNCKKTVLMERDGSGESDAEAILNRSRDIYIQAVLLYNQTQRMPQNRITSYFLGYKQLEVNE